MIVILDRERLESSLPDMAAGAIVTVISAARGP